MVLALQKGLYIAYEALNTTLSNKIGCIDMLAGVDVGRARLGVQNVSNIYSSHPFLIFCRSLILESRRKRTRPTGVLNIPLVQSNLKTA